MMVSLSPPSLTSNHPSSDNAERGLSVGRGPITLTLEDLDLFARASGDVNPLHMDDAYGRATPYGGRLAFGVLAALAAIGRLPARPGQVVDALTLDFHGPLSPGVAYNVDEEPGVPATPCLIIRDGPRLLARVSLHYRAGDGAWSLEPLARRGEPPLFDRATPDHRAAADIAAGLCVQGRYAPAWPALTLLRQWLGLDARGVGLAQLTALLWSSYLVGMRLPGRQATFGRLALTFTPDAALSDGAVVYQATVARSELRFDLARMDVALSDTGGGPLAAGRIEVLVRRPPPSVDSALLAALCADGPPLAGVRALVTGGGRGLGAALSGAPALCGAHVVATQRGAAMHASAWGNDLPGGRRGAVDLITADAADPVAMAAVIDGMKPTLDWLILNAAPPAQPLPLVGDSIERLAAFTAQSLATTALPLALALPVLVTRGGRCALISSSYVRETPPDWTHYAAAKAAAENLVGGVATRYSSLAVLVARPPRLLTAQTDTPTGRRGSMAAEVAAAAIVRALASTRPGGTPTILERFAD